jgi:16S rRNA (guanine527-N7)-methyltransferase
VALSGEALRGGLEAGAQELKVALSQTEVEQLLALVVLLGQWNARFNLTAIRTPHAMLTKHLLDSLSVARFLRGPRVVDVGTGAGFPGLPLAVARPALNFLLIDATAKKIRFVEAAIAALGMHNVEARAMRAEELRPREPIATVLARAVAPLDRLLAQAGHLVAGEGRMLAMKGRYPADELKSLPPAFCVEAVERLVVPGISEQRHLVVLRRR